MTSSLILLGNYTYMEEAWAQVVDYIAMSMPYILPHATLRNFNLCVFFTTFSWYVISQISYNKKLPPGPWGVPYLGYLLFMSGQPHLWYLKKAKVYGDVFSLKLGNNLVVCIGSVRLLKDLFNRADSTGRPDTPLNNLLGGMGIVLSEGALWKKQRHFLSDSIRKLGVKLGANNRFEKFVNMEVNELTQTLEKSNGAALDPALILGRHMHNVICQLMMSFRFEENDPDFENFNKLVTRGMKLYGSVHIGEHIRHYVKLPGKRAVLKEIEKNMKEVSQFHVDRLKARVEEYKDLKDIEPEDLLDCYMIKIREEKNIKDNAATIFPDTDIENQIVQVMNDLFSAGMETSRTSVLWSLIMMLREPQVAEKVREELITRVRVGEVVSLDHRPYLPYTEGVIYETLRMASVVPLGTTHVNYTDWIVNGYYIPAGSHIVPLLNKINMDPEVFPDPQMFLPERYIKDNSFRPTENFVQFGVGQRVCLGLVLARMELFLFFANIMNSFTFSMPEGQEIPGLVGNMGTTHAPLPFKLCFTKRED